MCKLLLLYSNTTQYLMQGKTMLFRTKLAFKDAFTRTANLTASLPHMHPSFSNLQ
jgi:hypothetical protein